ncbi:hypothetical protein HT105_24680, partial [Bacteroides fragilis]|nr:hypothetical protein [Bacteroides fragilis]
GGHALIDVSEVFLHLDKLLMLGQDSGAFRPGIFKQHVEHPEAIRMMTMESSTGALDGGHALIDVSEVFLHLDKLLMLGQDSGAFRPGI